MKRVNCNRETGKGRVVSVEEVDEDGASSRDIDTSLGSHLWRLGA
jgi:hypothetical protein